MPKTPADMPDYEQWREQAHHYLAYLNNKNYIRCAWSMEHALEGLEELMHEEGNTNA